MGSSANFAQVRHLFRRGSLGLESLFYDMRLDRAAWRRALGGSR